MKILFVVNTLAMGGAERVASILCNSWVEQGHNVLVVQSYSGGPIDFFQLDPRIRQVPLGTSKRKRNTFDILRRMAKMRQTARDFKPDVVVSFLTNTNLVMLAATTLLGFRRVVAERSDPLAMPNPFLLRLGCRLLYRYADAIVTQTKRQGERLQMCYGRMPRLTVISNPLPDGLLGGCDKALQQDLVERRRIVTLGRLHSSKRVELVIAAFERLAHRYSDWDLLIYGGGPCAAELKRRASTSIAAGQIHMAGRTENAHDVLRTADIFVTASDYEGFPNALMEAMAVGLPTVSTDCPCGPREMTNDGKDGLLVPVNDVDELSAALGRLMDDEQLRLDIGARAAERISSLCDRKVVVARWNELFYSLGIL